MVTVEALIFAAEMFMAAKVNQKLMEIATRITCHTYGNANCQATFCISKAVLKLP
jgi:hypothetical protein